MNYSDVLKIYRLFDNSRGMNVNLYIDGKVDGRPFDKYYDLVNIEFEKLTDSVSYLVLDFGELFYTMFVSSFRAVGDRIVEVHSLDTTVSLGVGKMGKRYGDATIAFVGFAGLDLYSLRDEVGGFEELDNFRNFLIQ